MNGILEKDDLHETAQFIESLINAPDNTDGAQLDKFAADIVREINET